ncbi:hypothetical protein LIER_23917 [Lithospermum erythrorhizon]|uniref:MATH domain-containing protein n=1 Tax=Lithospermum erythrorhizon TaxID=34254 RepID=A0AAV3R2B6_LITER
MVANSMQATVEKTDSFKWTIEGFSKLTETKYSEIFYMGGIAWRLLIFLKENKNVDYLSIYLDVMDLETRSQQGWSIESSL